MIVMQGSAGRHRVPRCMPAGAISVRRNIDRLVVSVNGIFARASTLYHKRMVRVTVFSRLLGRTRRAGDGGHRQAALTPAKRRQKRPCGRPWAVIGRRRAALVMGPHHFEARS